MSKSYRVIFLEMLEKAIKSGEIMPIDNLTEIIEEVNQKRWNIRNGKPTMDTNIIERYLVRYIIELRYQN